MIASVRHQLLSTVEFVRRCLGRFVELEGFDRAMALAGQAFAALLPLLIVIGSVSPQDGDDPPTPSRRASSSTRAPPTRCTAPSRSRPTPGSACSACSCW